ncbi:MAG: GntR family transcriptional regulator [Kiritimatiellae bacterium]|nr:GntR family transcriptional regulator [Kiritimatiellia bacterium]
MNEVLKPRYREIAEGIRAQITGGELRPGERIHSEEALAKRFGVARMTVRKGLDILVADGWLTRVHRRGTFVADHPPGRQEAANEFGAPEFLHPRAVTLVLETDDRQAHQTAFWRESFAEYARANPDVEAELASGETLWPRADGCDLITLCGWSVPEHVQRGLLRPLGQPLPADAYLPGFRDTAGYGVPLSASLPLLVANLDLLERVGVSEPGGVPADFEGFLGLLRRAGQKLPGVTLLQTWVSLTARIAWNRELETKDGQARFPERVKRVLEGSLELGVDRLALGCPRPEAFYEGNVLFSLHAAHALDPIRAPAGFRMGYFPTPLLPGARHRYLPRVLAVTARSEFPAESERLARAFSAAHLQRAMLHRAAGVPAHLATLAAAHDEDMPGISLTRHLLMDGEPLGPGAASLVEYMLAVYEPTAGAILGGELSLESGLDKLKRKTEALHRGKIGWGKPDRGGES